MLYIMCQLTPLIILKQLLSDVLYGLETQFDRKNGVKTYNAGDLEAARCIEATPILIRAIFPKLYLLAMRVSRFGRQKTK